MRLAGAGVRNAGLVEPSRGLAHPLEAPVLAVVVRAADDVETHRLEVPRDRRHGSIGPVAVPGIRRAFERARIEDRGLEVAERDVGAAQDLEHRAECRQALRVLRQRARNDQVADRDGRETVGHARLELLFDGPLRVELAPDPSRPDRPAQSGRLRRC